MKLVKIKKETKWRRWIKIQIFNLKIHLVLAVLIRLEEFILEELMLDFGYLENILVQWIEVKYITCHFTVGNV
jgi:hypothetical protein